MPATLYALEPEGNRYRFSSVREQGSLLRGLVGGRHAGDIFLLWNQKLTDTGSLLFAGKARSYEAL